MRAPDRTASCRRMRLVRSATRSSRGSVGSNSAAPDLYPAQGQAQEHIPTGITPTARRMNTKWHTQEPVRSVQVPRATSASPTLCTRTGVSFVLATSRRPVNMLLRFFTAGSGFDAGVLRVGDAASASRVSLFDLSDDARVVLSPGMYPNDIRVSSSEPYVLSISFKSFIHCFITDLPKPSAELRHTTDSRIILHAPATNRPVPACTHMNDCLSSALSLAK